MLLVYCVPNPEILKSCLCTASSHLCFSIAAVCYTIGMLSTFPNGGCFNFPLLNTAFKFQLGR